MSFRLAISLSLISSLLAACVGGEESHRRSMVRYESALTVDGGPRFTPVAIQLDSGNQRIAAYQVELVVLGGHAEIVGVEGGDRGGFDGAPYYDPAALTRGRIIIAAFSTKHTLPAGRHRVATVHMRETGSSVVYGLQSIVAADADGEPVQVRAFLNAEGGGAK